MATIITADNLHKSFNTHTQGTFKLENVSVTFTSDKTYGITGPSGSGKTTLLHMLALLIKPDTGTVFINKQNGLLFSAQEKMHFFTHTIGIVFQQPYVIPELSVAENCMLPGLMQKKSKEECYQKAITLLAAVELLPQADLPIKTLSGGQQQRVALARSLFNNPAFLLMDEPTGSLDPKTADHIINLIFSLHQQYKMGIIMSTHDKKTVALMDHCVTLEHNKSIVR